MDADLIRGMPHQAIWNIGGKPSQMIAVMVTSFLMHDGKVGLRQEHMFGELYIEKHAGDPAA
nr:hypothetical protein [uncultured Methanospirillum sp.]